MQALTQGDMKGTVDAKSKVEEGQRQLRKDEEARGEKWQTVFFRKHNDDSLFRRLAAQDPDSFTVDSSGGIWKLDKDAVENARRPFHGELLPTGQIRNLQNDRTSQGANGSEGDRNTTSTEQPQSEGNTIPQNIEGNTNGSINGVEKDKLEKIQIEEMLRDKYTSAPR